MRDGGKHFFRGDIGPRRPRSSRAYTLMELMMVVAIIGVLAAGLGMALMDTGGSALTTGQTMLATMVNTARAQAAVNQTQAVVAIYGNRPPSGEADKYLRLIQVFRNETPTAANPTWVAVGNAVTLPRGICVVPPAVNGLLASGVTWPSNPPLLSTVRQNFNLGQITGTPFGTNPAAMVLQFNADGTVDTQVVGSQSYYRLLVSTTTAGANNVPQFVTNGVAVRGLLVRPSGSVTFVNNSSNF